jgi:lysophospholipase L1-like esterase
LEQGVVDGLTPKVAVLKIGTNNLYDDFNSGSDAEIAEGIEAVVKTLRTKLPQTKILLCAILPRQNEYFCGRIAKINAIIKRLDDGSQVRWLDMTSRFQTAPGSVTRELYDPDQLHLVAKGYEAWAEAMEPLLAEMLK